MFIYALGALITALGLICAVISIEDGDWGMLFIGMLNLAIGTIIIFGKGKSDQEEQDNRNALDDARQKILSDMGLEDYQWICDDYATMCVLNEDTEQILFFQYDWDNKEYLFLSEYSFNDVLEAEVLIDGETHSKTSRSSQIGGALLGGVLAGGVGAIIGGLSGKTSSKNLVTSIQLKIVLNDMNNPIVWLTLFNSDIPTDTTDPYVSKCENIAIEWQSIFTVIINNADAKDNTSTPNLEKEPLENSVSISDEIRKLHTLFRDGILTEDEFNAQKEKLLTK